MTSEVGTDLRAVHVCGVPCLQVYRVRKRSMSADVPCPLTLALSEKSPHLGGVQVRQSLQQEPGM